MVADFVNDLSDKLLNIFQDLQEDRISFEKLGITYEEKAFYIKLVFNIITSRPVGILSLIIHEFFYLLCKHQAFPSRV